jgi:hypothetical protein
VFHREPSLPDQLGCLKRLKAYYDLHRQPASFDAVTSLVVAASNGATEMVFANYGNWKQKDYDNPEQRVESILLPACDLAGVKGSITKTAPTGQGYGHKIRDVLGLGHLIKKQKGVLPPREGDYITVTLRNSPRRRERNSDVAAWTEFAKSVKEEVIVIEDWEDKPIHLHERMALYEGAKMNFHGNNGPAVLCMFSDAPYASIVKHDERTRKYWLEQGMHENQQWPWATNKQRIFWMTDTVENLKQAYAWAQTVF